MQDIIIIIIVIVVVIIIIIIIIIISLIPTRGPFLFFVLLGYILKYYKWFSYIK